MKFPRKMAVAAFAATAAVGLAIPAHADVDTDFANTLHTYGIYGQRDFNAWIAKLTCQRLDRGVDGTAYQSADFLTKNLDRSSSTEQVWKFLGLGIQTYCPQHLDVLQRASVSS